MCAESPQANVSPDDRPVITAIIGGGGGCEAILRMVEEDLLGRFRMAIRGVADVNPDAPGLQCAREMGVELVTTDYRELYQIPDLGLLIELRGLVVHRSSSLPVQTTR